MNVTIIYAKSTNNVIGKDGQIPWHIPEDLQHFKRVTQDGVVIMGRKTWDSLPIKPLPKRTNVVLTSVDFLHDYVIICNNINDALNEACYRRKEAFVIGGSNVIKAALKYANKVIITEVLNHYEGDTVVEDLSQDWIEVKKECHKSATGIDFNIIEYIKKDSTCQH